jgi:hypothetical protein
VPKLKRPHIEDEAESVNDVDEDESETPAEALTQCSGTTKKGTRCRLEKMLPVGELHFCKSHPQ